MVFQAKAEPPAMDELHRVLSLADEVIRHKVLRIPEQVYGTSEDSERRRGGRIREETPMAEQQHRHRRRATSPAIPRCATPPSGASNTRASASP